jgi:hypothetical protein
VILEDFRLSQSPVLGGQGSLSRSNDEEISKLDQLREWETDQIACMARVLMETKNG